jgi:hypothetical protein
MHSRCHLELDPLVRVRTRASMFLEDTLGRAVVGVRVGGLQRGETLRTCAGAGTRGRGSAGGFEGKGRAGVLGGGDAQGELGFCGAGGVHFVVLLID